MITKKVTQELNLVLAWVREGQPVEQLATQEEALPCMTPGSSCAEVHKATCAERDAAQSEINRLTEEWEVFRAQGERLTGECRDGYMTAIRERDAAVKRAEEAELKLSILMPTLTQAIAWGAELKELRDATDADELRICVSGGCSRPARLCSLCVARCTDAERAVVEAAKLYFRGHGHRQRMYELARAVDALNAQKQVSSGSSGAGAGNDPGSHARENGGGVPLSAADVGAHGERCDTREPDETTTHEPRPILVGSRWANHLGARTVDVTSYAERIVGESNLGMWTEHEFRKCHRWVRDPETDLSADPACCCYGFAHDRSCPLFPTRAQSKQKP